MKFVAIIPARFASTRFPGKPLAILGGKPVIQHVYEKAAAVLGDAYVAPSYAERNGGYTRIIRTGVRRGDAAETAIIELVK